MILALECDYRDDSESYNQIHFGNANNLRLTLELEAGLYLARTRLSGKSMAPTPYAISNHDTASAQDEYLYSTLTIWHSGAPHPSDRNLAFSRRIRLASGYCSASAMPRNLFRTLRQTTGTLQAEVAETPRPEYVFVAVLLRQTFQTFAFFYPFPRDCSLVLFERVSRQHGPGRGNPDSRLQSLSTP